jgi:hypothetical protein
LKIRPLALLGSTLVLTGSLLAGLTPPSVPDTGLTALLLCVGLASVAAFARVTGKK